MNGRLTTILTATAAAAMIAVGCGSDDDATSGSAEGDSSSLSKETFVKRASAACSRPRESSLERVAAYQAQHRPDGLPKAELNRRAFRAGLLLTIEAEVAALRKLGAPAGDEEEIEAIITALQAALGEAKEGNRKSFDQVEDYFAGTDKMLQEYGLTGCMKRE